MALHPAFKSWLTLDDRKRVVLNPAYSYMFSYGGRGGGKSEYIGEMLPLVGTQKPIKVVCVREFMTSIDDSVMPLLLEKMEKHFPDFYERVGNEIRGRNGTLFSFKGLARNIKSIKSLFGYDVCWIEEGDAITATAWEKLDPTIRKDGSTMIISMNRDGENSVLDREFIQRKPPERTSVIKVNYTDNPFPIPKVIEKAERMKRNDYELYQHIYLGELNKLAKEQVLYGRWRTDVFETPTDAVRYIGADWSNGGADPHTLISCYVKGDVLYIDNEMVCNGQVSFDILEEKWRAFPPLANGEQWRVRCDEANGINTREMKRRGFNAKPAPKKWAGVKSSVQAGINYLRSFKEIVIHERCKESIKEAKYWRWKVDKDSGEITPILIDSNDHLMSALRYGLVKRIKKFRQ